MLKSITKIEDLRVGVTYTGLDGSERTPIFTHEEGVLYSFKGKGAETTSVQWRTVQAIKEYLEKKYFCIEAPDQFVNVGKRINGGYFLLAGIHSNTEDAQEATKVLGSVWTDVKTYRLVPID